MTATLLDEVRTWLLDSDPAIRWQVMRDLTPTSADEVEAERARVAAEGWGRRLLDLQAEDGNWGGGSYTPKWTSTTYTLLLLRHFGIDPADPVVTGAIERVRDNVTIGNAEWPFFSYRTETCVTGLVLTLASYFIDGGDDGETVVDFLLGEQLEDGGWNCATTRGSTRASFNTTIMALEGLLEYERATGADDTIRSACERGHEYLLDRHLFRSLRTGEVVSERWKLFSFPPRWHYDVLRGLEYLTDAGVRLDGRADEAIALVESKRRSDGRWLLQSPHAGLEHFRMENGAENRAAGTHSAPSACWGLDARLLACSTGPHIDALIKSGGGTGPVKPRQPTRSVPMPER